MHPDDPSRPGGHQAPGGYPSPQGGYVPPPQPYGAPPAGYPPPYGYPPRPKTGLWIGLGIGLLVLLGAGYFLLFDTSGREADIQRGYDRAMQTRNEMRAQENAAPAPASAPAAPAQPFRMTAGDYMGGRFCEADGSVIKFEGYNSQATFTTPAGRAMTLPVTTMADYFVLTINGVQERIPVSMPSRDILVITMDGRQQTLRRC